MKTRFSTFDLMCSVTELQRLIGMRVGQVYDVDHKTYLIKLQRSEEKCVLLIESGSRIHTTAFEWPKNVAPSGFSMKMRKHLRNKRLEKLQQLGIDRVLDMQFGSGEAAYHIILELYDRGNIVLTDCDMYILNVLRPHIEGEEVKFAVREKYPLDRARQRKKPTEDEIKSILSGAKPGDAVKNLLNRHMDYGPAVIDHVLQEAGFPGNCKLGKTFDLTQDMPRLLSAITNAEALLDAASEAPSKGYIVQKKENRVLPDGGEEDFFANQEFHPIIFKQHSTAPYREFTSFDAAVDEFFSTLESQKIDMKALHQEKEALKKLDNVRRDHTQRLEALEKTQELDRRRAELITCNQELVDNVILVIRAAIASQAPWADIEENVYSAKERGDPVASIIHELKLSTNHVSLQLSDPYAGDDNDSDEEEEDMQKSLIVDIDLDLSAFSNARKYYDQKRTAAKKQQKTIESQVKAFKSAEKKTKQTLKEVQAITHINKVRKVYWFEKFHWFISSENYLVIGGRDPQQNELIVKRYLNTGDIYVHADIQGASSIVIKNSSGQPVPPKTLNEAGIMAMSYSVAWDAKVVTSAWWVHHDQVSKTAPTGEYLTTGAFMIRGKKNYLLPSHLIMGFSFLFKLEDSSIERHKDERKVRNMDDDVSVVSTNVTDTSEQDQEIELEGSDDENDEDDGEKESKNNDCDENDDNSDNCTGNDVCNEGDSEVKNITNEISEVAICDQDSEKKVDCADSITSNCDSTVKEDVGIEQKLEENSGVQEKIVEFPDVELKIEHSGNMLRLQAPNVALPLELPNESSEQTVYLGDDIPVIISSISKPKTHQKNKNKNTSKEEIKPITAVQCKDELDGGTEEKPKQLKRGQKGKLKKIKEKYKDQDEEDRKIMMEILKSEGGTKIKKKKGKEMNIKTAFRQMERKMKPRPPVQPKVTTEGPDSDGDHGEEKVPVTELDMLDSLTGQPLPDDELLFAVPVVAPYATLQSYKFKVKLTPGTGKRGKAAKTAMNIFLRDKMTTAREKDLIRSVKDELLARNLPGKVKVSAPQLQKIHK